MVGGALCRESSFTRTVSGSNLCSEESSTIVDLVRKLLLGHAARVSVLAAITSSDRSIGQALDVAVCKVDPFCRLA